MSQESKGEAWVNPTAAKIVQNDGVWELCWPWPSFYWCLGCENCPEGSPGCSLKEYKKRTVTTHKTKGAAARFARQRGMGPLLIEE